MFKDEKKLSLVIIVSLIFNFYLYLLSWSDVAGPEKRTWCLLSIFYYQTALISSPAENTAEICSSGAPNQALPRLVGSRIIRADSGCSV